ncbi:cell division protein FtsQ/DivIB [Leisingera aquaemixtae]|jgi:cell division protein FtsQ|uniref:Cell division protein FtsQ n=1 Tax=Leisingera aquaemixtae TaxID=1396826 RepID=A0A0P1H5P7_9RHOB|nr:MULTISPECIES: cell division protein FtsQ/DivIB [Leisingera]QDI75301.1 FtsQ-type POTRA domain-containing protein [Leisingera aquaemixtae]UWQ23600.1 cell division protein FtsQ/DivIB [Leisingera aquaemixtae]UWQ36131.1 cell division protein FtsQ/DivIB [Leisingera aquaemixtae]UWQ40239.1 cell division protein FtsQ/DivIB [Leisingera aquaemixtae]UWQ44491.1 cell division protein FtsQ/DivIB [Leisingera aquaemixtae]
MQSLKGRFRRSAEGRADPAPSRLKYRLQRWMLTPGIRFGLRFGVPLCLVLAAGSAYLADEGRRDTLQGLVNDARAAIQERPEFMVKVMAVDGAGTSVAQDIREVVPLDFPVSSFDLDLEQIRDVITGLDPVKSASVRIRPGGILQVDVEERQPALIWRSREGLALLDETGTHVAELGRRSLHPDLPLIAGKGAAGHAAQALRLFAAAKPLGPRLRGLVRIGERRWDLVLDRKQRIMLPAENPVRALERVLAVSEVQDLLERDVAAVDMRLAGRPTIRMSENAVENWWRIRQLNGGGQ